MHSSGENRTPKGRRGVLSGYQLGWLRPEQKWWAYRPLHEMLCAGKVPEQWIGTRAEQEIPVSNGCSTVCAPATSQLVSALGKSTN